MDLTAALHEHFGFPGFRPGQREACEAALADRDVMVVMPTGSGKSLCYQLPALLRDDLTVVVSPLVALMQDQVEALAARGLGHTVALVNAQQDAASNAETLRRAETGELRLLYVAPERFAAPGFLDRMRQRGRGPVRGGRGALRLAVGSRLPARLLPARGRRADPRAPRRSWRPRPRPRRRWRATWCGAWRCAIRCGWPPASTGRTSASRWRGRRGTRSAGWWRRRCGPRTRCRRSSTRARGRARRSWRASSARRSARRRWPTTPGSTASGVPRCSGASWPTTFA